ncbi:MAG: hypothetical protein ABFD79_17670 [Phycisphaerales bacterium]
MAGRVKIFAVLLLSVFTSMSFAAPGSILSYASTGESEVWGMDVSETGGSLQIHMVAGHTGQVYKFGADSLAAITNGSQGVWDSKTAMFGSTGPFIMGLSIVSTYNGDGFKYIGYGDNIAKYTSTWGDPSPVGSLSWGQFETPYTTYAYHTDMTPASRGAFSGERSWDTWTVNSADFGGGVVNALYKYPNLSWTNNIESYLVKYDMPKTLIAVALGGNNDLWVLCADKEILHVSSIDGSISDRFYLDSSIAAPFGMTYSTLSDSLWISDQATFNIYQVSVSETPPPTNGGKGTVLSYADTGETAIYGIDVREIAEGLEIHLMATGGQIYKFGASPVAAVKNGTMADWDDKVNMMDPCSVGTMTMGGLALIPTYEGSYGLKYIALRDNMAMYQSIWGNPDAIGDMEWVQKDVPWEMYAYTTDITPASRVFVDGDPRTLDIWTVNSADFGAGAINAVYRYSTMGWMADKDMWVTRFIMPKPLRAVALGDSNNLWVLCTDGEVLNISSLDGTISDRFYIDTASIDSPWGMAYSNVEKTLWISNWSNKYVYQVATRDDQYQPLQADINGDNIVDMQDFAKLASEWLLDLGFIQDRQALGLLDIAGTSPTDGKYDWGACSFLDTDGKYKMWWTRQGNPNCDRIFYADSNDGQHWFNTQQVLSPLGGSTQEQVHVAHPSVVKVGATYYMFYEAPNLLQGQIFLATSTNGINWTRYPSANNPQPIIAIPSGTPTEPYGLGMPCVFYKDGQFHMFYMSNLTGWPDQTRYAVTSDPTNWGPVSSHTIACAGAAGLDVTWNSALNKYVALYVCDGADTDGTNNTYIFTSTDGVNWNNGDGANYYQPYLWTISIATNNITSSGFENPRCRAFPNFFTSNPYGTVDTARMYFSVMDGELADPGQDWQQRCATWNLYAGSVELNDGTVNLLSDLNGDGTVDRIDLSIMALEWLKQF